MLRLSQSTNSMRQTADALHNKIYYQVHLNSHGICVSEAAEFCVHFLNRPREALLVKHLHSESTRKGVEKTAL